MISFFYETKFKLNQIRLWKLWIKQCVEAENYKVGDLNYIFCDDEYLLQINREYLNHDYYTDVIGFQYSDGKELAGDIYISIERIAENAKENRVKFHQELARVMIHGVLHFMNYRDKSEKEAKKMRELENKYIELLPEINANVPRGTSI